MPPSASDEPLTQFLEHELARAGYHGTFSADGWHVERTDHQGSTAVPLPVPQGTPAEQTERLLEWLESQRRRTVIQSLAMPRHDVRGVHELAETLYKPYHVRGGLVRLAGCQLLFRFFIRITFLVDQADGQETGRRVRHLFVDANGTTVADRLRDRLGLCELTSGHRNLVPYPQLDLSRVETCAEEQARQAWGGTPRRLWSTVIAVKWAAGKLEFVIDDATASVDFEDWAVGFRDEWRTPPPFVCPATGLSGYELERTDDGEITVPDAIETCTISGRRLLKTHIGVSAVSGKRAAYDLLVRCPVSKEWLLDEELVTCTMCHQRVSPLVVVRGRCRACRTLERVPADEHRVVMITEEWSFWRRDRRWLLSETDAAYIAVCRRLWEDWLLVLDKPSLTLRRIARRRRFSRKWLDVDPVLVATDEE